MHTYYLLNPESPDGRRVVYYASKTAEGHIGQVCVLDRATGVESVLADDVHTEDAHRVALQQWTLGGRAVAFHEVVGKRWRVVVVDVETGAKRIVAENRQLGFGRGDGHTLPLYGPHWNPGSHRGLELYDLRADTLSIPCAIGDVEEKYGDWLKKEFAGRPTSIAFPTISPDHRRVFFKLASGNGGDAYMGKVSDRQGIVFFDLEQKRLTHMRPRWGHPAWHPDSFHWIEMGNVLYDAEGKSTTRIPDVPALSGQHLAVAPSGKAWVQDGLAESLGGPKGQWAVIVAALGGGDYVELSRFTNGRGARSWRVSHPHPVFSADSRRLYFNVSSGDWTQLHVAECSSA